MYTLSAFEAKNAETLAKLKEVATLQILPFPEEVIDTARSAAAQVIEEYAASDPFATKVYDSLKKFRKSAKPWAEITEQIYYDKMLG